MPVETQSAKPLGFGIFEVDLCTDELRKKGVRIKLKEQRFSVLAILLSRLGEIVTRGELRSQVWSADTFVDFDNSLNTAVNKLREALGDSADTPRFIETVPRCGYRSIAPVRGPENETPLRRARHHGLGSSRFPLQLWLWLWSRVGSRSRAAHQDFLALWKDADPDIITLKQAKVEYANLR